MEEGSNKGTDITERISTMKSRVSWQTSQQAQLARSREKAEKETNESKMPHYASNASCHTSQRANQRLSSFVDSREISKNKSQTL